MVAIAASFLLITESKDETHESLDLPGLATSALGLFALTYGLIEANAYGWTSARIVGSFVVAVVSLTAFVLLERRQRAPMLDLSLFRSGTYAGANIAMLLVALAMFGVFFFVSLYMQNVLGYSAVQAGAAFLPMTILIILVAPVAGKASDRFGSRWLMTIGMVLLAVQLLYLSQLGADASFWKLLPGFLIGGLGMAMTMTPTAAAATRAVPVEKAGVGSAVLNAMRQVGGSVGIALMGAIVAAEASGRPRRRGLHGRLRALAVVAAVIAFAGAIVAFALVRQESGAEAGAAWRSRPERDRADAPAGRGAPAGDRRGCDAGLLDRQLQRRDDGRDRPRGRDLRADPLPALRLEARALLRLPRRAWARLRRPSRRSSRSWATTCAVAASRRRFAAVPARRAGAAPNLWIQALTEAGEDPEIARLPAAAHAGRARLHRRRVRARAGGGRRRRPTATPTPRRGSSSAAACCSRSPTGSAACSTGDFAAIAAQRTAGSPAAAAGVELDCQRPVADDLRAKRPLQGLALDLLRRS